MTQNNKRIIDVVFISFPKKLLTPEFFFMSYGSTHFAKTIKID